MLKPRTEKSANIIRYYWEFSVLVVGAAKMNTHRNMIAKIITVLSIIVCYVSSEDCGQEELTNCARPLQILQSTSELSIAAKKEELEKLCPDLHNGLHCIRSYTRRCMTLQQRNQFNKMYHGTNQVIRDLCKEGQYQDEFLKHAPCLRVVQAEYEVCTKRYQETMAFINQAKTQENVTLTEDESVRTVCCSFTEYLDCSEQAARKTCGEETAQFTRGFLDKMSSTLVKTYCDSYYKGSGRCREFESAAPSLGLSTSLILSALLSYLLLNR